MSRYNLHLQYFLYIVIVSLHLKMVINSFYLRNEGPISKTECISNGRAHGFPKFGKQRWGRRRNTSFYTVILDSYVINTKSTQESGCIISHIINHQSFGYIINEPILLLFIGMCSILNGTWNGIGLPRNTTWASPFQNNYSYSSRIFEFEGWASIWLESLNFASRYCTKGSI